MLRETEITVTDLALGDDLLAVLARIGLGSISGYDQIFISGYGNRSASVSYQNLQSFVPHAVNLLKNKTKPNYQILHGASQASFCQDPYSLEPNRVEYLIHGDMGYDNSSLDPKTTKFSQTDLKLNNLDQRSVSILSLAATTEVADLLHQFDVNQIPVSVLVLMGGVLALQGNTDPYQEANFRHDPWANQEVFKIAEVKQIPTVLVPLDLTENEQVLFTADRLDWLSDRLGTGSQQAMSTINSVASKAAIYGRFYLSSYRDETFFPWNSNSYSGVPVHDLTAALVDLDFRSHLGLFCYAVKNLKFNDRGEIGLARDYMTPNYKTTIAGEVQNYDDLWKVIAECFKQFN